MRKESKANLIFVIILIATMVPGITMLVRRKLNGDHTSAALPDPAPYVLAYNQPPPTPPGLSRMEPTYVREWVRGVVRENAGIDISLLRSADGPVVSDGYFTQAVAIVAGSDGSRDVWLLIWRDAPLPTDTDPQVRSVRLGIIAMAVSFKGIDIPPDVRHALQSVGYIDPPPRAWLGRWRFAASKDAGPIGEVKLIHHAGAPSIETITLP